MSVSDFAKEELSGPSCEAVFVDCIKIIHPRFDQTIKICNHNTDIDDGTDVFTAWACQHPLVNEIPGQVDKSVLVIDNVTSDISAALKAVAGSSVRPQVIHKLITTDYPAVAERGPTTYFVRKVHVTLFQITAELVLSGYEYDAIPRKKIDPTNFPGAFGVIR